MASPVNFLVLQEHRAHVHKLILTWYAYGTPTRHRSTHGPEVPLTPPIRSNVNRDSLVIENPDDLANSCILESESPSRLSHCSPSASRTVESRLNSSFESCPGDLPPQPSPIYDTRDATTIIRGTFNQSDPRFGSESRGRQCTAIAKASIAMSFVADPHLWAAEDVDYVVMVGDLLYQESILARTGIPNEPLAEYLATEEVVRDFCIGSKIISTNITNDVYGNFLAREYGFRNLRDILELVRDTSVSGILTSCGVPVSLIGIHGFVGYFDSHSRSVDGEIVPEGVACLVSTSDIEHLHDLLIRNLCGSYEVARQVQCHFTKIDVQIADESNDHRDRVQVSDENDSVTDSNQASIRDGNLGGDAGEYVPENAICDMNWIFDKLHDHFDDHSEDTLCNFSNLKLISTYHRGLSKSFEFKCEYCGLENNISSTPNGSSHLDLDLSIIIGCLTIGIGQSQLAELLGASNIRCMSDRTYQRYHGNVPENAILAAQRQMEKNREEEKALAHPRGDYIVNDKGEIIYFIDGEGDGCYEKRSYVNSEYSSPAACVVIIGRYTRKVLDIEVVQKSCILCTRGTWHTSDECYRNHGRDESSTTMETKAFARIFSRTLSYNIIIRRLVTDGDAKNYLAILNANPYGEYGIRVENVLCAHGKERISWYQGNISNQRRTRKY
ncbi:hypothetical protein QAD02_002513 [Eretmocerus hayati]|uniref:Uncharacterized protein n=1 Tax=Eretmocerus hayati TaxID=131215 RepID=A0ACC2NLT5_9HYME|nr:hypothetical protein QAD02_002513 [Eretmocerus hayati]